MLAASARYGNVFDYAGPNLASNELALHANTPPPAGTVLHGPNGQQTVQPPTTNAASPAVLAAHAAAIAKGLGAQLVALETPNAGFDGDESGPTVGTDRSTLRRRNC